MHDTMAVIGMMKATSKTLLEMIACEVAEGKENVACHVDELGKLVDMVKDFSEAEEKCMKKKYYEMLVGYMMEEGEDMAELGRMGYDNWKYANGRYAPKGHGHRIRGGFTPMPIDPMDSNPHDGGPYWYDPSRMMTHPFGYPVDERDNVHPKTGKTDMNERMGYPIDSMMDAMNPSKYGTMYDEYKTRKKYYTQTGAAADHESMEKSIEDATYDSLDAMKEMWMDAKPETRKKLVADVTMFLEEMKKTK